MKRLVPLAALAALCFLPGAVRADWRLDRDCGCVNCTCPAGACDAGACPAAKVKTYIFHGDDPLWRNNLAVQNDPDLLKAFNGTYESVILDIYENEVKAFATTFQSPKHIPIPGDFAKLFEGYVKPHQAIAAAPQCYIDPKTGRQVCPAQRAAGVVVAAAAPARSAIAARPVRGLLGRVVDRVRNRPRLGGGCASCGQ